MTEIKRKAKTALNDLTLEVLSLEGKPKEKVLLDKAVFDGKVSLGLLQQAANTYLSNKRTGLASTKTRGERKGSGRKPWRQKGTGRARVGSIRSPLWRGGGVVFGPKPRSFYKKFPGRMKALALKSALNAKLKDSQIVFIDKMRDDSSKAKDFLKVFSDFGISSKKICFVAPGFNENLKRASANFKKVSLSRASDINALGVLDCKVLVLTKDSLDVVQNRVKKWI